MDQENKGVNDNKNMKDIVETQEITGVNEITEVDETINNNNDVPTNTPSNVPTKNLTIDDELTVDKPTESSRIAAAEQEGRDRTVLNNDDRPNCKNREQKRDNTYAYLFNDSNMKLEEDQFSLLIDVVTTGDPTKIFKSLMHGSLDEAITMVTKQMSAKKGLKVFGNSGTAAVQKELEQLMYRKVMHGKRAKELTRE